MQSCHQLPHHPSRLPAAIDTAPLLPTSCFRQLYINQLLLLAYLLFHPLLTPDLKANPSTTGFISTAYVRFTSFTMDKLKNLAGGAGGSAGNKEGGASGQNEDYVDKVGSRALHSCSFVGLTAFSTRVLTRPRRSSVCPRTALPTRRSPTPPASNLRSAVGKLIHQP